jgi:hypothetical protein
VWDHELRREADWRALGGWRLRHVERGAVRARGGKRWRRPLLPVLPRLGLGQVVTVSPVREWSRKSRDCLSCFGFASGKS